MQELEPKFQKMQDYLKWGGMALVAFIASMVVAVAGASIVVAGITLAAALVVINVLPVIARMLAMWRQQALTKIDEVFSEERIREDEREEGERIGELEKHYKASRSNIENAMEELMGQLHTATPEEQNMLQTQIDALNQVIREAENTLATRKQDYEELQRVNKLYIAYHRSALAMEQAQGTERDPAQLQSLETARASIKTRMRAAMAGKTIEAMNKQIKAPALTVKNAALGNSMPRTVPTSLNKEKAYALQDRS